MLNQSVVISFLLEMSDITDRNLSSMLMDVQCLEDQQPQSREGGLE